MSRYNLENNHNSNIDSTTNERKSSDYLKTLERGLEVIKSFKDSPHLTISESSKITGLSRPVTRRVLITLETLGYANSKNGRYSLTPKILSLGYSYISSQNIWEIATPYLEKLSETIQESSSLATLDATEIVYVARVSVNKIMKHSLGVGTRLPAHASSVGKVLLAFLSDHKLDLYFQQAELRPYTEKTVTSEDKIREDLLNIREQGWALSHDQLEMGLLSIAAPIRDIRGEVVAAVNCATHSGRCNINQVVNEFLPLLLDTAEQISSNIDFEMIQ
ncbi:IclR family transcriptional regulator domain-containing protein [Shouchella shacheensis]|uniref:IclR family transcriptional regulator domain-containing protein n=1 Tax=Shouchella shacheensis TaxID=1649580 RepID=UPI00073FCC85|nr:IclR family transcriptional regulator C-terminal domain-containing protein [Shouchella shacheensis]